MRHIVFCATLGVVAAYSIASFAAQNSVLPDGQYLSYPGVDTSENVKCSYQSLDSCAVSPSCADCTSCDKGCDCGCGLDYCGCGISPGIIAGYEFIWLKPHFSGGTNYETTVANLQNGDHISEGYGFPTDYKLAPRVWIGYQFCSGFAARLRYWQFDQGLDSSVFESDTSTTYTAESVASTFTASGGATLAVENGIKADVIDLDFTQDFNWRHTCLTLGGGLSYAGLRLDRGLILTDTVQDIQRAEAVTNRFEGIGPTVLAELKRQIRGSGFSVVGGVRGTVLFGRQKYLAETTSVTGQGTESWQDGLTTNRCRGIVAASIGVQYDREILNGTDMFVRLSWEGQYWNGFGSPVSSEGDLAFEGLGIAMGIRR